MILDRVSELNAILLNSLDEAINKIQEENQAELKQFKINRIDFIKRQLVNDEDISEEEFKEELAALIKDVDQKKLQFKDGQRRIIENIVDQYSAQLKKIVLGDMPIYIEEDIQEEPKVVEEEIIDENDIFDFKMSNEIQQPVQEDNEDTIELKPNQHIEVVDEVQVQANDEDSVMEKLSDIKNFDVADDSEVVTKELDDWISEIKKII